MATRWIDDEVAYRPDRHDVHQVFASDSSTGVWLRVSRFRTGAWFQAALLRAGQQAIVLAEEEIPHPGNRWELRSSGLWADHNCETPGDHWSYGLEAFALALDDPEQLVREGVGDRVPIGWELDFEANSAAVALGKTSLSDTSADIVAGYSQQGFMHGLLLTKEGETAFEAPAIRHHWWGDVNGGPVEMNLAASPSQNEIGESAVIPVGINQWTVSLAGFSSRHVEGD